MGQHVHERSSHVPTINGVPQSPLIMVPSIEEDRVRPLLQQPIHSRGNSRYSTYAIRLLPLLTRSGSGIGLLEPGKRENNFRNEESIYHPPSILSTDPPIVFNRILLSNMYIDSACREWKFCQSRLIRGLSNNSMGEKRNTVEETEKTIDPNHRVPDPEISLGRTLESNGACHAFRFDCSVYVTDRYVSLSFSLFLSPFLRLIPRIASRKPQNLANSRDQRSDLSDYLFTKNYGFN